MRQAFGLAVLLLVAAGPVHAQQEGPGRSFVKELLRHAPDWVENQEGTWEGMRQTNSGWEPSGTPIETSKPVFNYRTKRPYSRSIYQVTFTETLPPPRTYTATVVFEDFGQSLKVPQWEPSMTPVLVTRGEEQIPQDPVRKSRWEYEEAN